MGMHMYSRFARAFDAFEEVDNPKGVVCVAPYCKQLPLPAVAIIPVARCSIVSKPCCPSETDRIMSVELYERRDRNKT